LGLRSFLASSKRLLMFSAKPGREELWLSVKICFLGVTLIGAVGFVIRLLAALIGLA